MSNVEQHNRNPINSHLELKTPDKMEFESNASRTSVSCEGGGQNHSSSNNKMPLPKITVSPSTESEGGINKRFSTGSDYADWGNRLTKQDSSGREIGKFFDGMGLDRGVLEPLLSVQYANIHPASSSSLNLLDSASTAGCILDTDQDNCDKRSDFGIDLCGTDNQNNSGERKQSQPTPEDTNDRIMQWLTNVSPNNSSQDDEAT